MNNATPSCMVLSLSTRRHMWTACRDAARALRAEALEASSRDGKVAKLNQALALEADCVAWYPDGNGG